MEYEFTGTKDGFIKAIVFDEFSVFGYWLNNEIEKNLEKLQMYISEIEGVLASSIKYKTWIGSEFSIELNEQDMTAFANIIKSDLSVDDEELMDQENLSVYESEFYAIAGVQDVLAFLNNYKLFLEEQKNYK